MTIQTAIDISERYERSITKMESKAIARLNKSLDAAYADLERELTKAYPTLSTNATILQAQRKLLIMQKLGSLLQVIDPSKADLYERVFADIISKSNDAGVSLSEELIKAVNPRAKVAGFDELPVEAVANAASDTYTRLLRHGETFADRAALTISEGIAQGWTVGKVRPILQQQLGVTKAKAKQIVRTETISALSSASQKRYADSDIDGVLWLAIGDSLTCRFCVARNGKVYKLGSVMHPPHPSCRCVLSPCKRSWIDAGIIDTKFLREYHQKGLNNVENPDYGLAPFERAAGWTTAPKPIWSP